MASITVNILDATGNKRQEVELPDNAPVNRIIAVLLDKMNLPKNGPDGQPLSYKFINITPQELHQQHKEADEECCRKRQDKIA